MRVATIPGAHGQALVMWIILLEAFAALVVFVFIVWWTMFSGRPGGERHRRDDSDPPAGP